MLLIAATGLGVIQAVAYPAKEAEMLTTISYAIATAGHDDRKGAEAFCRQARSTLTSEPKEAYLFAHVERCFGSVADVVGDKAAACKHFRAALALWEKTPPPNDHPQSVASRNQLRVQMQRYVATNCETK